MSALVEQRADALHKALTQALLSLKAICEPCNNGTLPDAQVCGVIARGAIVRVQNDLPENLRRGALRLILEAKKNER